MTSFGHKYQTLGYLIYRIEAGKLQTFGLFETRKRAEQNLLYFDASWKIEEIEFCGWGIVNGIPDRNAPPKLDDADAY